jgi:hypothetical protein
LAEALFKVMFYGSVLLNVVWNGSSMANVEFFSLKVFGHCPFLSWIRIIKRKYEVKIFNIVYV